MPDLSQTIAVGLAVSTFIATCLVPIVLELIKRNGEKKQTKEAGTQQPIFGMTVEGAVERADRIAADYLAEVKAQRDRHELRGVDLEKMLWKQVEANDAMEARLSQANAALSKHDLPNY